MEAVLLAENLVKEYRHRRLNGDEVMVRALDQVSLKIYPGVRIAIVGPSGSGKSTFAACLACFERPTSGALRFQDRDLTTLSEKELRPVRPQIQLVFQDPAMAFNPRFSVLEIIEEPWLLQTKLESRERIRRAAEVLMQVGLPESILNRNSTELSGGQRQRLAIARALALEPKILILDEALSALDYSVQSQIVNLMLDISDPSTPLAERLAVVFITHDLVIAARVADEIAVMHHGRIVESGPVRKVIGNPNHAITQTLIASTVWAPPIPQKGTSL